MVLRKQLSLGQLLKLARLKLPSAKVSTHLCKNHRGKTKQKTADKDTLGTQFWYEVGRNCHYNVQVQNKQNIPDGQGKVTYSYCMPNTVNYLFSVLGF